MKNFIKTLRRFLTFWVASYSPAHLQEIRIAEANRILPYLLPHRGELIIEIGGGAGWQNKYFADAGINIESYDKEDSYYSKYNSGAVQYYDGTKLPLSNDTAMVIFSSNTLEHIVNLDVILADHLRVLKPGGMCIHILPTASWRMWTSLTDLVKKFYFTGPHGELCDFAALEIIEFSEMRWRTRFNKNGFDVVRVEKMNLFYTGNAILGPRLSIKFRKVLAQVLGSACKMYILEVRKR